MNEQSANTGATPSAPKSGMNRREAVKRGAMVTGAVGAAWTAPMVYDSFTSTAWAGGGTSLLTQDSYNGAVIQVSIRANSAVEYEIAGAGGGGGASCTTSQTTNKGGAGGAGTKLTGTIPPNGSAYTLYVAVGQRGNRGVLPPRWRC